MFFIILLINVTYVSLLTVRTMLTLKGQKYYAAFISAFEVFMFVLGLGLVIDNLGEVQNLIAYALGFSLGIILGAKIEEKLAIGYVTVKVISKYYNYFFPQYLRKEGFGITSWVGKGGAGKRLVMEILTSRREQHNLYNHILAFDPEAFIISHEPQHFKGGFWLQNLKRYTKKYGKNFDYPEDYFPDIDEEVVEGIQEKSEYIDQERVIKPHDSFDDGSKDDEATT